MHLEHINLVVRDLNETLKFYKAAFPHWRVRGQGESDWYGTKRTWLHFGDDYHYVALNDNGAGTNRRLDSNALGLAHFAFVTSNLKGVINNLKQAGFEVDKQGIEPGSRQNAYFIDPNGYEIEFVEYLTDLPEKRNTYA